MKDLSRPRVTVHYAQTLDGRIATRTHQSQWIGGEASLRYAHQLRANHEAVLVGVGTVMADDPRLTVRLVPGRSPLRVVLDSTLRLPMGSHLLTDGAAETLIATTDRAPEERIAAARRQGAKVVVVGQDADGRVDLAELLHYLSDMGIASVLIEGGQGLITTALRRGLVDRLTVCLAPKLLGLGIEAVGDLGISSLTEALTFQELSVTRLGEDLILDGLLQPSALSPQPSTQDSALRTQDWTTQSSALSPQSTSGWATAAWFPAPRQVELRRERLPKVEAGQVRVRAIASALSHGTEMLVYRGQVPTDLELDLPTLAGSFSFPIKYGYAGVGRVEEVGAGVEGLAKGDTVFVHHPHQDEYVVPASMAVPLSTELPPELGVFLANLETAINVLLDAAPRLGERVVILGQGVVGLLLTALARRAGAGLVVAVDPLERRRQLSLEMGADLVFTPEEGTPEELRRLTRGTGADVVLEASGDSRALQQAIECAAFQGRVVVCSWYGSKAATLQLGGAFHRHRLQLLSSQVSSIDPALQSRWSRERRIELARNLLHQLPLEKLITHRIPFREITEAYRLADLHPEQIVQILVTYQSDGV